MNISFVIISFKSFHLLKKIIENIPEDQLHPYLMIECPRMIFPFLRRIVSDVTRDGGFPSLNLEMVDFLALYRNEIQRRVDENAKAKAN